MTLSLSVRIAEEFASKEKASLSLPALAELAIAAGYDALCMRASQVGIHSPQNAVENAAAILAARRLGVTMITGNFDVVYNNEHGPACLRKIGPHLELAGRLGAPLIRVALKSEQDIDWAKRASDEAAEFGLKLVHQCHTQSLFETVEGIERTLRRIDRPNFGIIYEPANLELCGQEYRPGNSGAACTMDIQCLLAKPASEKGGQNDSHNLAPRPSVIRFDSGSRSWRDKL